MAEHRDETGPTGAARGRHARKVLAVVIPLLVLAASCNRPFDFNGDDKADVVWWDTNTSVWYTQTVTDPGPTDPPMPPATTFFTSPQNDQAAPGDYDGSGKFTPGHVNGSSWITEGPAGTITWAAPGGFSGRWLVPGAYDGNHKTLPAYYVDSTATWYIYGHDPVVLGSPGTGHNDQDMPVPADYDGDGITDLATYNPWTAMWTARSSRDLSVVTTVFGGGPGGYPAPGDFNGDGNAEPAWLSWTGVWSIQGQASVTISPQLASDFGPLPAVADYDGDGKDDLAAAIGGFQRSTMALWRNGNHPLIGLTRPSSSTNGAALMTTSRFEYINQVARLTWLRNCKSNPGTGCPS